MYIRNEVKKKLAVFHIKFHPQSNGIVARMLQIIKMGLKAFEEKLTVFYQNLVMACDGKLQSPSALMGRQIREY